MCTEESHHLTKWKEWWTGLSRLKMTQLRVRQRQVADRHLQSQSGTLRSLVGCPPMNRSLCSSSRCLQWEKHSGLMQRQGEQCQLNKWRLCRSTIGKCRGWFLQMGGQSE